MKLKPKWTASEQPVFGWKLDLALDPNHELVRLAAVIPWEDLKKEFGRMYVSDLGRLGIPVWLMAGLHLLKHTYGLSDEQVVKGWVENPCWQHFCGEEFFQHRFPIHPSQNSQRRRPQYPESWPTSGTFFACSRARRVVSALIASFEPQAVPRTLPISS
jgi:IS5 family transposase